MASANDCMSLWSFGLSKQLGKMYHNNCGHILSVLNNSAPNKLTVNQWCLDFTSKNSNKVTLIMLQCQYKSLLIHLAKEICSTCSLYCSIYLSRTLCKVAKAISGRGKTIMTQFENTQMIQVRLLKYKLILKLHILNTLFESNQLFDIIYYRW